MDSLSLSLSRFLSVALSRSLCPFEACLIKRRAMCQRERDRTGENECYLEQQARRGRVSSFSPPILSLPPQHPSLPLAWAIRNYPAH